jgi:hypothetical protein
MIYGMRLAGHLAPMGRTRMHIGYWWERDHWEGQDVGGWTILKWILGRYDWMVWIGLIWLRKGISGRFL